MALSTTGYQTIAPQPGTSGTSGSYIPVTGAGATLNGATQYTNGPYTLNYSPSGPNGAMWEIASSGSLIYYVVGTPTTMPLTGWTSTGAPTPYPTFAVIAVVPPSISGIFSISGILSITF